MKASSRKIIKIVAGLLAFALIGILLFASNAFAGNPVSASIAKSAMKKHIASLYPDLDYRFDSKVGYNFKNESYVAVIQALESEDTRFYVEYHGRGDIKDDYEHQVRGYMQTLQRLERSYGELLREEWSRELGVPIRHVQAMYQTKEAGHYKQILSLDMPLDTRMPISLSVNMSMDADDMDVEQAADLLVKAHRWARTQGYRIEQYGMDVEYGEKLLMIYSVRVNQIEGNDLVAILEQARRDGEYSGVSVIVKGEKQAK